MVRDGDLHSDLIAFLVKRLNVQNYLELGAGYGETLMKVTSAGEETCRYTAVDVKAPAFHIPGVAFFVCSTADFLRDSAPSLGPFDFVFIDADHHEAAARADLEAVFPHVTDHGLILLHDTWPGTEADTDEGLCGSVWKVAAEFVHPGWDGLECVTLPFHPGLSILRKRTRHLAWP